MSPIIVSLLHYIQAERLNSNPSARFQCLEATFVFVFSLLRPENLLHNDSSDHHSDNKKLDKDQNCCHETADNLNRSGIKGLANGER